MRISTLPLIVLCLFMGFTFWVMAGADQSLLAFGAQLMSSPNTAQVVIDLYILAALACVWMYQDAKIRGKGLGYLIPFFVITAVFVSAGPLLYLVLRGRREPEAKPSEI
ncbi:DUF2834 domain-containing protein [Marinobacter salsuginis]|uniref:DUF2834 domain-containing protein n=1 Tax=Marinobacter salsuginis TaxID=418719 RepID=A0A5M3PY30_9GAMM|nr:DUF2834 domain-containing protein [Marinobacter salsuginis]GBO87711.1 hypothetical protein MSSD14B_13790 [Marinobacter salsuginis]